VDGLALNRWPQLTLTRREASLVPEIVDHVERADDHTNPGEITPVIVSAILEADLVVADLTDANPNVYYELAIAHAYGKPTVHIRLTGEILPFDMKDVRVFEYGMDLETGDRARKAIADAARAALTNPGSIRTPISGGTALLSAQLSGDPGDQISAQMVKRMGELESAMDRLGRRILEPRYGNRELAQAERRLQAARELWVRSIIDANEVDQQVMMLQKSGGNLQDKNLLEHASLAHARADESATNLAAAESTFQSVLYDMERQRRRSDGGRDLPRWPNPAKLEGEGTLLA